MFRRELQLPQRLSTFVLGPRQTGKSTLIKASLPPDAWTVDLLRPEDALRYAKHPESFREEAERRIAAGCGTIFVDEIQKVPALLDVVHHLIAEHGTRFVLSGSSARKLRRGGVNLLGGRAAVRRLHPLTAAEMGDAFDLERALRFGTLPSVATAPDDEARDLLMSYAETYLREEVYAEALVRDLGSFARFLDVAASQSGDLLNAESVARDASVAARTVRAYYQLLEDTLLGFRLEAWRKSVRARLVAHARFMLFDPGVVNAFNRRLGAPPDPRERGRLFEQWLILECRRIVDYAASDAALFFWRTNVGAEVDLLVEKHGRLMAAVQCETSPRVVRGDLGGLRAFAAENPEVPCFVVTPRAEEREIDGALVLGWRAFLDRFRAMV
jgi:predicted AAA+ superfamily ATPase